MDDNPYRSPQVTDKPITPPLWIRLALWRLHRRIAVVAFLWLSLLLTLLALYGFRDRRFFVFGSFIIPALWYGLAIRWMDRNRMWQPTRS
jgi:hypothetical protein